MILFDFAAHPVQGTLIYRNPLNLGEARPVSVFPSPLQVQMPRGMFDIANERNNAGCQVGKSQATRPQQSGKTWSSTRHDFNKIPPVVLLKALVQGKLKSRVQLKEITV